jgi:arylsulfatase A-like enzyme
MYSLATNLGAARLRCTGTYERRNAGSVGGGTGTAARWWKASIRSRTRVNLPARSTRQGIGPANCRVIRVIAWFLIVSLAACTASSSDPEAGRARTQGPPNVLVIITDDQRAGTLAVMPKTRAIFARGGTQFVNGFTTTPQCCPSRASIYTGRYAHNHGVLRNVGFTDRLDQRTTLQRYLQGAGYRTAFFGKYLNEWSARTPPPYFDDWSLFIGGERYYGGRWNVNGEPRTVDSYSTTYVGRSAARFLARAESDDDRPWLMFVAPTAPHLPIDFELQYENARVGGWRFTPSITEQDRTDKPGYVQAHSTTSFKSRKIRRRQLKALKSVDDVVNHLFVQLDRLGEDADTLAIFMSDNGLLWGDHGLRHKSVPYRSAVKIPLLLRWPDRVEAGVNDDRLVANIDVAPTVLDAAELVPEEPMDGVSLLDADSVRHRLLLEYWRQPPEPAPSWASTLTPSYQYVEYYTDADDRPDHSEYYHLSRDPWQLRNLLGDDRALNDPNVVDLSTQLARDRSCAGPACP